MLDLIIKNATVVNHDGRFETCIGIKEGKIVSLCGSLDEPAQRTVDAYGLYAIPGAIDPHIHIGYPDWDFTDDCIHATSAAALGGVTCVMDFLADENSVLEQLADKRKAMRGHAFVDIAFHAGIYTWDHIDEIDKIYHSGINSFKFYLPMRGPDVPQEHELDDGKLFAGFKEIAKHDGAIALIHAEDIDFFQTAKSWQELAGAQPLWTDVRPAIAEVESIKKVGALAGQTGCKLYIVHVSSEGGLAEIAKLMSEIDIVGETCPHYLTLNVGNVDNTMGKINPPLRTEADNRALWEGLESGIIRIVGTDHSSCAKKHKQNFWEAVPGFAGLGTFLPVMLSEGVNKRRITLEKLVDVCCFTGAQLFGLHGKGEIRIGGDADVVLIDLTEKRRVKSDALLHISDFTPFEGMEFTGWPVLTIKGGRIVAKDGKIMDEPAGRLILRG